VLAFDPIHHLGQTGLGGTLLFTRSSAKLPEVERAELLGERAFGGRDRVIDARLEADPVALVLQRDRRGTPAMADPSGIEICPPFEIFTRIFMLMKRTMRSRAVFQTIWGGRL
jgi:hypothetical protein